MENGSLSTLCEERDCTEGDDVSRCFKNLTEELEINLSHCDKYSDGDLCHDGQPCVLVDGIIYYLLLKFNNLKGCFFSLRCGKVLM